MAFNCPNCGYHNPEETPYCLSCAAALAAVCPACGQLVALNQAHCDHCGNDMPRPVAELSASAADMLGPGQAVALTSLRGLMPATLIDRFRDAGKDSMGEKREVTVVCLQFGDGLDAQDSSAEAQFLAVNEMAQIVAAVVFDYEGHIDRFHERKMTALFGAPVAHENDPERAVRAATAIVERLSEPKKRLEAKHGLSLSVRIGIHTGTVIVGRVATNLQFDYTIIGDTVQLASRLQRLAPANTILVSSSTYQRTRPIVNFEAVELDPDADDGERLRAYGVLGLRKRPGRVRGLPNMHISMVGRQDLVSRLLAATDYVREQGEAAAVFVTGEAGVGKSRLMVEFRAMLTASRPDVMIYEGSCLAYARSRPYWLIADLLRNVIGVSENDSQTDQLSGLQQYLRGTHTDQRSDLLPYLAHLLGLSGQVPEVEQHLGMFDAGMLQKLTHDAVRQLLIAESRLAPLVMIFEDLHWIDDASLGALRHLAQTFADVPVLVVLVTRGDNIALTQELSALAQRHLHRHDVIELHSLTPAESHQLVDQLLASDAPEMEGLKRRIVERAGGNPFYTEEIIRMLVDEGVLTRRDGRFHATSDPADLMESVPGTLQGLILTRVDSLEEEGKRVLQRASVIGPVFRAEVLAMVSEANADATQAHLATLTARHFLVPATARGGGYEFRHVLIRDTIYNSLLTRYRRAVHEQTALAIANSDLYLPHERTEMMAYHLANGRKPATAIPHLLAAAKDAAARYANETALDHYRKILALMNGSMGTAAERNLLMQVHVGMGRALKLIGAYPEASEALRQVTRALEEWQPGSEDADGLAVLLDGLRELADVEQREGNYQSAASHIEKGIEVLERAGRESQPDLYRALLERLAFIRFRQGQLDDALSTALRGIAEISLDNVADPVTVANLFNTLGGISWQLGNVEQALDYVQQSLRLYQNMNYAWGMAQAYSNLGVLNAQLGNWTQTIEYWEKALALRAGTADVLGQATGLSNLGQLRLMMGKMEAAKENLEESLAIFRSLGDDWGTAQVMLNLAQLALAENRFGDARDLVDRGLKLADEVKGQSVQIIARWTLALLQSEDGQPQEALVTASEALKMAKEAGLIEAEAECLRVMGLLLTKQGNHVEAETMLKQSSELSQQMYSPYNQGLSLLGLGQLYRAMAAARQSNRLEWLTRALDALHQAEDILSTLGALRDLRQVHASMEDVEERLRRERIRAQPPEAGSATVGQQAASGERRLATVLWLALSLPPEADEETVFETMAFLLPACATIAQEYGGYVRQRPDGLTVVFGAPVAYEDGPDRAVQVATLIAEYVQREREDTGVPLDFRIGITQGSVLAGYAIHRQHSEFVVQGEPLEEARGLAERCAPGEVRVTGAVRRATGRLVYYRAVSDGRQDGAEHWELIRFRETPGPARGIPGVRTRFIGRDAFLQAMNRLSHNLEQGIGGIVWIEGEAGIGKSRLMLEFRNQVLEHNPIIWSGGCAAQRSKMAFSLFSDLVSHVFSLRSAESSEEIRSKIQQSVDSWPADIQSIRPYLELLAGINPSGLEGQRIANLEPDQLRQQIFVAFRRLLKTLAREQPLVLLLDDLHWIDPMSSELLLFVATIVASDPVLLVCAQRREGGDSPNDRVLRLQSLLPGQTARLFLDRLSVRDSETLIHELMPNVSLPEELIHGVISRSEGNPYFIEEFVRMFVEQGYLRRIDEGWEMDPALTLTDIPVPTSLEALIRSRVDALPADLKQTIQCASIIGRRFRPDLLQELVDTPNVGLALERLASRVILRPTEDGDRWEFTHHLIESVVYGSLLRSQRQDLHLRLGEALERRWAQNPADHAEELAHHFNSAGAEDRALEYLLLAGEKAISRNANEEALTHLQRAAEILSKHSEPDERAQWRIAVGLGDVYRFIGKYVESTSVLQSGLPLAQTGRLFRPQRAGLYRRLGETAQKQGEYEKARQYYNMTQAMLGDPDEPHYQLEAARTLTGLAWVYFSQGRFDHAREACEASLAYAAKADGLAELASAENLLGGIHYHLGEWHTALHHTTRAMVLREQMGYSWGVAATLSNLGILSFSAGHWSKALSFFQRSLTLRQEMGDVEGMAITNNNLGMVYREQGDLLQAEAHFAASLETARLFKIAYHVANAYAGLASVQLLQGDLVTANNTLSAGIAQAESIGAQDVLAEMQRLQAEILLAQSRWQQAEETALAAAALAAKVGNRIYESTSWRVASETARRQQDLPKALGQLERARQAMAEVKEDLESARIALQAGRIQRDLGNQSDAEAELRYARQLFTRLGADLYLHELERLAQS